MTSSTNKSDVLISENDLFNHYLDEQHEMEASQVMKDLMMKRYLADATVCAMECELRNNALPTPTPISSPKRITSPAITFRENIKFNTITECIDREATRITGPFIPITKGIIQTKNSNRGGIFSKLKKGKAIQLGIGRPKDDDFDENLIFQMEKRNSLLEPIIKKNSNNGNNNDEIPIYEDEKSIVGSDGSRSYDDGFEDDFDDFINYSSSLDSCIFGI